MELISSSPTKSKEFEFQYFSTSNHNPADDLFYKGTLLPLHLPPRRQMLQHLLRTSAATTAAFDQFLTCSTAPCTNSNTPLDSCNISPSQSCRVSCELNPNETLFEWPTDLTTFFNNQPRSHSWSKKLKMKLIKHSLLAQKLKSSRAYLKSLFSKSSCSDEENNYSKIGKKFATYIKKTPIENRSSHRRSFSGAITAHSTTKSCSNSSSSSSSTSTSFNSSGLPELQFSGRRSSAEIEVSIDAAIAHCKKSMQSFGICSLPSPEYVP